MDFICGLDFLFYLGVNADGEFIVSYPPNAYVEAMNPVCW